MRWPLPPHPFRLLLGLAVQLTLVNIPVLIERRGEPCEAFLDGEFRKSGGLRIQLDSLRQLAVLGGLFITALVT